MKYMSCAKQSSPAACAARAFGEVVYSSWILRATRRTSSYDGFHFFRSDHVAKPSRTLPDHGK